MDHVRSEVLRHARSQLGPQAKGSTEVFGYWREVLPPSWSDAMVRLYAKQKEWCGGFALWCLRQAGLAASVNWIDGVGFLGPARLPRTLSPEPGDIAYFAAPFHHHAIVESFERVADKVVTVGGREVSYARWELKTIDGNQPNLIERTREHCPGYRAGAVFYSIAPLLRAEAPTRPDLLPIHLATVRRGSSGLAVRTLQTRLALVVDGTFGPKTEAAVMAFQRTHGLQPDGVVGPKTWSELGFP